MFQVVWSCLVEDSNLFLKYFMEQLTRENACKVFQVICIRHFQITTQDQLISFEFKLLLKNNVFICILSDHKNLDPLHSEVTPTGCVLFVQLHHWIHHVLCKASQRKRPRTYRASSSYIVDGSSLCSRNHVQRFEANSSKRTGKII